MLSLYWYTRNRRTCRLGIRMCCFGLLLAFPGMFKSGKHNLSFKFHRCLDQVPADIYQYRQLDTRPFPGARQSMQSHYCRALLCIRTSYHILPLSTHCSAIWQQDPEKYRHLTWHVNCHLGNSITATTAHGIPHAVLKSKQL
jgi:hypothetical protein